MKLLFQLKLLPISYRIAVGPQQGPKAFMIRTIRPLDRPDPGLERVAKAIGTSPAPQSPITAGVGWSHQPGVAKASSPSPTQNSAHLPNVMRQGPRFIGYDLGPAAQARFNGAAIRIDIEVCGRCGGPVRVIVEASNRCIEDQDIIPDKAGQALDRILTHLRQKRKGNTDPAIAVTTRLVPSTRAPPGTR